MPAKTKPTKEEKKYAKVEATSKPTKKLPANQPTSRQKGKSKLGANGLGAKKLEASKPAFQFKLFNKWEQDIVVADMGLKRYITLTPLLVPFSQGRDLKKQFRKSDKHIVERLILRMMVTGHRGKKHYHDSGHHTGKYAKITNIVKQAFEIIEQKTKKNPLEVFVRAVEAGAPREGVTTIEYGGVRYPKAVDLSPQRRIDLVLRWICQGAFHAKIGKGKKQNIQDSLANQIMLTAAGEQTANAIQKRIETERSSSASR